MFSGKLKNYMLLSLLCLGIPSITHAKQNEGVVKLDGSSTVFPIAEAVAEEYRAVKPDVRVTVGASGTGGGFKKFYAEKNRTDINNASRPIKEKEIKKMEELGIGFIELPIAFDGITVVISSENTFVDYLTVEELNKIWGPESKVEYWSDIRPKWPKEKIALFGPGTDSGTFDYFTEVINGKGGKIRPDFTASEDDNVLVKGVAANPYALGYFGYAYYLENKKSLRAVPIRDRDSEKAVIPTSETINKGRYTPLSRPMFIYVNQESLKRKAVKDFVMYYLDTAGALSAEVGYIPLPNKVYALGKNFIKNGITGSKFSGVKSAGKDLIDIMNSTDK